MVPHLPRVPVLPAAFGAIDVSWLADLAVAVACGFAALFLGVDDDPEAGIVH